MHPILEAREPVDPRGLVFAGDVERIVGRREQCEFPNSQLFRIPPRVQVFVLSVHLHDVVCGGGGAAPEFDVISVLGFATSFGHLLHLPARCGHFGVGVRGHLRDPSGGVLVLHQGGIGDAM